MHGTDWMASTTIAALLIREAGTLARRLLAYRQQRWLIRNAASAAGQIRSIEITSPDKIIVSRIRARRHGSRQ